MGAHAQYVSSPSSSLQRQPHTRVNPQLQIHCFPTRSTSIHYNHYYCPSSCGLEHADPYASSFRHPKRRRRRTLLLEKSAPFRSHDGAGGSASNDDDGDDSADEDGGGGGGGGEGRKTGTILGAVAMIIGTSIGTGMLVLPQRTYPAGFVPTSVSMIICWCFLLVEALLLVEVNVNLRKRKKKRETGNVNGRDEWEFVSIRTMAKETLGEWGGNIATVTYIFFGYTSMVAYCSKSGEILASLVNLPASVSSCLFTILFTLLIVVGGKRSTDHVNRWLTTSMIGFLLTIEVLAPAFGGWAVPGSGGDWNEVPPAIPVMIFSLVYHDITPVLCAYLDGDITRIRTSVILGSVIPLSALLIWEAVALGLSSTLPGQSIDPIELLMRVEWSGMPFIVEAFSLLAVGTSMIGTLLSFSEFFKEQLNNNISSKLDSMPLPKAIECSNLELGMRRCWGGNRISLAGMVLAVSPSLFLSTKFPDAFSAATDLAGGYCMTMLYGVLPPAMAWAVCDKKDGFADHMMLSKLKPALVGVGLFASGIVVEQLLQDFPVLNPLHIMHN